MLSSTPRQPVNLFPDTVILRFQIYKWNHMLCVRPPGRPPPFRFSSTSAPGFFMDCVAASSMRTTRKPACPSVSGLRSVSDALREVLRLHA